MDEILLMVVSLALGGVIGYFTSYFFYKKSELFEQDMRFLAYSMEVIYLRAKFPHLYESPGSFVKDYRSEAPADLDVPHLIEVRCDTNVVSQGDELFFLFTFVDDGRDLSLAEGVEVRNNLNNYLVPVGHEGFGWMSGTVAVPADASSGPYQLVFNLEDRSGNSNTQEFTYVVKD